ncbi:MAG: DUF4405 domain-containing protein [Bacteroidales bacterium]|nr:DUF4405 domain-containing protein [Bacteroidales bacterium]
MKINWHKNKTKINLVIDAMMLLVLMAIAGLGFLIKYVLIPGYKRNAKYPEDVELYYMGLTRHEWGRIHLILGFILLFLLLLHIILHWNTIVCIFRNMFSNEAIRRFTAVFFGMVCLLFLLAPLVMKPEVVSLSRNHIHRKALYQFPEKKPVNGHGNEPAQMKEQQLIEDVNKGRTEKSTEHRQSEIEIYGHMSLNEIAARYNVDVTALAETLNIPSSQSDSRIGRLKKQYGFRNSEIREVILKISNQNN